MVNVTAGSGGEISVLCVDDDEDYLGLIETRLETEFDRLDVDTEASPRAALQLLDRTDYDCVVADYRMSELDGLDLLRAIREDDESLPVIFFTGKGSEEIASEAISAGVTDYIQKEGSRQNFLLLGNRIVSLVDKRRAERQLQRQREEVINVYERIQSAFLGLDADWRVTYVNSLAADLIDVDADAVEGAVLWDAVPALTGGAFEDELRGCLRDQETTAFETEVAAMEKWFAVYAYPSEDGVSLFVEDVTEQKAAEAELEQLRENLELSESKFRALRQKVARPPAPFRY